MSNMFDGCITRTVSGTAPDEVADSIRIFLTNKENLSQFKEKVTHLTDEEKLRVGGILEETEDGPKFHGFSVDLTTKAGRSAAAKRTNAIKAAIKQVLNRAGLDSKEFRFRGLYSTVGEWPEIAEHAVSRKSLTKGYCLIGVYK